MEARAKSRSRRVFAILLMLSLPRLFAEPDVASLLAGYLKNDLELKELAVKLKQAEISRGRTQISNGLNVTLSTGTVYLNFDDAGMNVSGEPNAEVSVPAFNNTSLSVSAPLTMTPEDGASFENIQLSLSTAIIGPETRQHNVDLLRAERSFLEAKRALDRRSIGAERDFYNALRSLYDNSAQALSAEEDAYTKDIELAVAVKQGYAPSTLHYRTVRLEAEDARRTAQERRRALERELAEFARDCGAGSLASPPEAADDAALEESAEFGTDAQHALFTEIEKARWQSYIGGLSRDAQGNLDLSARGGVTLNNTRAGNGTSADAGITLGWKGVNLSAGAQFPLSGDKKNPAITLSLGINANKQRTAALDDAEKKLEAESEALALAAAERSWEDTVETMRSERSDLIWERKRLTEQKELYEKLAADTASLFRRGFVSESEHRKAQGNAERARCRLFAARVKARVHLIDAVLHLTESK